LLRLIGALLGLLCNLERLIKQGDRCSEAVAVASRFLEQSTRCLQFGVLLAYRDVGAGVFDVRGDLRGRGVECHEDSPVRCFTRFQLAPLDLSSNRVDWHA
jgi:hypothetical protein